MRLANLMHSLHPDVALKIENDKTTANYTSLRYSGCLVGFKIHSIFVPRTLCGRETNAFELLRDKIRNTRKAYASEMIPHSTTYKINYSIKLYVPRDLIDRAASTCKDF